MHLISHLLQPRTGAYIFHARITISICSVIQFTDQSRFFQDTWKAHLVLWVIFLAEVSSVLNWAVRYYPIVRILRSEGLFKNGTLLEIGSGPVGIGLFRKAPFIGCDVSFDFEPRAPLFPLMASATELPFADHLFDVVLASDMLEHVPVPLRTKVVSEALRVSKKLAIFAFPSGEAAWNLDRDLRQSYKDAGLDVPVWLDEHMLASFPESDLFAECKGWSIEQIGNDNLEFHAWLIRKEMSRVFCRAGSACLRLAPRLVESILKRTDCAPYYRQIFVLRRQNEGVAKSAISENPESRS
jgi:hypothetical protein